MKSTFIVHWQKCFEVCNLRVHNSNKHIKFTACLVHYHLFYITFSISKCKLYKHFRALMVLWVLQCCWLSDMKPFITWNSCFDNSRPGISCSNSEKIGWLNENWELLGEVVIITEEAWNRCRTFVEWSCSCSLGLMHQYQYKYGKKGVLSDWAEKRRNQNLWPGNGMKCLYLFTHGNVVW